VYREKYGDEVPLIRRQDVRGFITRPTLVAIGSDYVTKIRRHVAAMELQAEQFYTRAAQRTTEPELRELLSNLAAEERKHESISARLAPEGQTEEEQQDEQAAVRRLFLLQIVQPGLAGLMDGSVSTLAPLFAAAFATHETWPTFLVGLAASIGAGISMGFAEALSDDGSLTGRGHPALRGFVSGLMTFVGGFGHAVPFLIPHIMLATTVATIVVAVELLAIAWIRKKYMDTPFLSAMFQVVVGGVLVFLAGILIGNA
jgi:rubrerythrin